MSESQNPALEAFLTAATEPAPSPAPPQPQATEPEPSAPKPQPKTEGTPPVPPPSEADADGEDGSETVPVSVVRKMREDNKSARAAAEARVEELRAQVEALQNPKPAHQPGATMTIEQRVRPPAPDFRTDPEGYVRWQDTQRLNDKLDGSEAMLRREIGREAVTQIQEAFRAAAEADPTLWDKLYMQQDPYDWARHQVTQMKMLREIGSDPEAYRAKMRAEWEAEMAAKQAQVQAEPPPISPAAGLPPSLANVRSSAPRGEVFNGPPPLEDVVGRNSGDRYVRNR